MANLECEGGTFVTVMLRTPCNYRCHYCSGGPYVKDKVHTVLFDFDLIKEVYSQIKGFTMTELENGRGEPSLHPQIKDILSIATDSGGVRVSSNNSSHPDAWIPRNRAHRIQCNLSLHPEGESKLEEFIDNAKRLTDLGCNIVVSYVVHPSRMDKVPYYVNLFEKNGIKIDLQLFIGEHKGKEYPRDYTEEELRFFYGQEVVTNWKTEIYESIPNRNFKGIPCVAGSNMLCIRPDGSAQRCLYDRKPITKISEKPYPCQVDHCGCGFFLEEFNNLYKQNWNNWRKLFGFTELELSQEERVDSDSPEFTALRKIQFLNLLRKHNKISLEEVRSALS